MVAWVGILLGDVEHGPFPAARPAAVLAAQPAEAAPQHHHDHHQDEGGGAKYDAEKGADLKAQLQSFHSLLSFLLSVEPLATHIKPGMQKFSRVVPKEDNDIYWCFSP